MTVMTADRTGEMNIISPSVVDEIVGRLKDPVWKLVCAGKIDAALILMDAEAAHFWDAWRQEYASIPAPPAQVVEEARPNCTSMEHADLNCAAALAAGTLDSGAAFCEPCSKLQQEMPIAPAEPTVTGTIVHIVTPVGSRKTRKAS